jgi:cytochrome c nitrite reductase small subunit
MRTVPLLAGAIGALIAVGGYTFIYAKGYSYLTNDPAACANCHVMEDHYRAWMKSSHRSVAVCNDCHTPPGLIPKYTTKAVNGFNHSLAFTTGRFPEPLRITPRNTDVTEKACRKCHEAIVAAIEGADGRNQLSCIRCHSTVGHLE